MWRMLGVRNGRWKTVQRGGGGGENECPKWQLIRIQTKQLTNCGDTLTHLSFLAEILFSTNV
jgi:hypothetical protein